MGPGGQSVLTEQVGRHALPIMVLAHSQPFEPIGQAPWQSLCWVQDFGPPPPMPPSGPPTGGGPIWPPFTVPLRQRPMKG